MLKFGLHSALSFSVGAQHGWKPANRWAKSEFVTGEPFIPKGDYTTAAVSMGSGSKGHILLYNGSVDESLTANATVIEIDGGSTWLEMYNKLRQSEKFIGDSANVAAVVNAFGVDAENITVKTGVNVTFSRYDGTGRYLCNVTIPADNPIDFVGVDQSPDISNPEPNDSKEVVCARFEFDKEKYVLTVLDELYLMSDKTTVK